MSDNYILVNGKPTPESDLEKWAEWFECSNEVRRVAYTLLNSGGDVLDEEHERHAFIHVSTVFLGLNHNFRQSGAPILYETLAFACEPTRVGNHTFMRTSLDSSMRRYCTRDQALAGHAQTVANATKALRQRFAFLDDDGVHWPEDEE